MVQQQFNYESIMVCNHFFFNVIRNKMKNELKHVEWLLKMFQNNRTDIIFYLEYKSICVINVLVSWICFSAYSIQFRL